MNLMPYKCKTHADGRCKLSCDYVYYGIKMKCYQPLIVGGKKVKTSHYDGGDVRE